jgi:hypothetical protein
MDARVKPAHDAFVIRLQFQRCRVDAVAQSGRSGTVLEHMAEMAIALRAQHLGADHAVADVPFFVDMALDRGRRKTRPAATGIEFGVGFEQRLAAAGAGVSALALLMLVFARERPLGRLLAQHGVLHRRQFAAPLGVGLFDSCGFAIAHHGFPLFVIPGCASSAQARNDGV